MFANATDAHKNHRISIRWICLFLMLAVTSVARADKPNIVIIMADDIGLGDVGFYHRRRTGNDSVIPTPNIDQLAREGMRFSDAHSPASLCAPTRFSMLTGNFPMRGGKIFGVWSPEGDARIDPNFTTSARLAKAGGYHTAFFGKWGLGGVWNSKKHTYDQLDAGALSYGFDYAVELPSGIQNSPLAFYENRQWMKLGEDSTLVKLTREQAKFTRRSGRKINLELDGDSNWDPSLAGPTLAQKVVQYIGKQTEEHPGEPFFLYYCSQAVHIPHAPPEELDGVKIAGTTPSPYGDMIVEADTQVGMVVKALKQAGAYDNTLFIFTSDNGGLNYDKAIRQTAHDSSNGLRGKKGSIYEGGHRVPFIAVWPGKIEPGSNSDEPIIAHDVVPTVAALSGQTIDREAVKDAVNLLPLLTGGELAQRHKAMVHASKGGGGPHFAIRVGDWKLIMSADSPNDLESLQPVTLFNLAENLEESDEKNLIEDEQHATRVQAMMASYLQHRQTGTPTVESVRLAEDKNSP